MRNTNKIFLIPFIALGVCALFIFPKTGLTNGKCGDGICDNFERANISLCPKDCISPGKSGAKIKVSSPITPFASMGDLWFSTWADDDTVFVSWGDGLGPNPGLHQQQRPPFLHHGLARLKGTFPDITAEVVQRFMPLSDDVNNSKPGSLLFYNKRLYVSIHSPLMSPDKGFIAYSEDSGKTFRYNLNTPWTKVKNSNFICRMFINMGKGYNLNSDGYVYAFGMGSEVDWGGSVYLGRVKKDAIMTYSAWEYFSGMNKANNPKWLKNQDGAAAVPGLTAKHLISSIYHPGLKSYIAMSAETINGKIFTAPNPWGPWTLAGKWFDDTNSEWVSSYMPGIIPKGAGANSFYFAIAGAAQPAKIGGQMTETRYCFRLGEITLELVQK